MFYLATDKKATGKDADRQAPVSHHKGQCTQRNYHLHHILLQANIQSFLAWTDCSVRVPQDKNQDQCDFLKAQ